MCGGPLCEAYNFFTLIFRWGPTNTEGSEHMVDSCRMAMEVQAVHVKNDCNCDTLAKAAAANALLIISYLYQVR